MPLRVAYELKVGAPSFPRKVDTFGLRNVCFFVWASVSSNRSLGPLLALNSHKNQYRRYRIKSTSKFSVACSSPVCVNERQFRSFNVATQMQIPGRWLRMMTTLHQSSVLACSNDSRKPCMAFIRWPKRGCCTVHRRLVPRLTIASNSPCSFTSGPPESPRHPPPLKVSVDLSWA